MRCSVVVGAGQIGSLVAQQLAPHGAVRVVSRTPHAVPAGAVHVQRDLMTDDLSAAFKDAHVVFLAVNSAYTAKVWAATLPVMQRRVVDAAAHAGAKLVVLENLYTHGPRAEPLREDMLPTTTTKKGAVRQAMTEALFARARDVRLAAVRPPDFWGPGLTGALINEKAVREILAGKPLNAIGDVDAPHARAYAADVARAMCTIAAVDDDDVWGRVWHPPVIHASTRAMVSALARAGGVKDPGVRALPRWAVKGLGVVVPFLREMDEMLYQWDRPYLVDDGDFRKRFGASATSATSLEDGSASCVAAVRSGTAQRAA